MMIKRSLILMLSVLFFSGLLSACSQSENGIPDLKGTSWQVEEITGQDVASQLGVTLNFEADDKAGGKAPCNSYFADYNQSGEQLTFSMIGSTEMACLDEGVMDLESDFFQSLGSVVSFTVENNNLVLTDENGIILFILSRLDS